MRSTPGVECLDRGAAQSVLRIRHRAHAEVVGYQKSIVLEAGA